jgi:hypothetical protein
MVICSKLAPDLASELRTGRRSVAPGTSFSIVSTESATPAIHGIAPIPIPPSSPEDAPWFKANGSCRPGTSPSQLTRSQMQRQVPSPSGR